MEPSGNNVRWQQVLKRLVFGRSLKRTLIRAAILAVLVFLTCRFVLLPVRITGESMEPTYHDNSINAVNRLAYLLHKPRRGDVVAVHFVPQQRDSANPGAALLRRIVAGPPVLLLKRIVGLPGETVAITNGVVYVNGQPLDEPYVKARDLWQVAPVRLTQNEYFLIGDNRGMDQRAHLFGRAERDRIVGKLLW